VHWHRDRRPTRLHENDVTCRWGTEEATRAFKQLSGVEDFRVRKWESIPRLTFMASMAVGIQALLLIRRARTATRYIARVLSPQFFDAPRLSDLSAAEAGVGKRKASTG
jgi:hypothetical protein